MRERNNMRQLILKIYDYFEKHPRYCWCLLAALLTAMILATLRLDYREDIVDFLPLSDKDKSAFINFQNKPESSRIFVIFEHTDSSSFSEDKVCDAIDTFASICPYSLTTQIGTAQLQKLLDNYYQQLPYQLSVADYHRIDSILQDTLYINQQLENIRNIAMLPTSGEYLLLAQYDPLHLFSAEQSFINQSSPVILYDGYIFSSAKHLALAYIDSPYGTSETMRNSVLTDSLQNICKTVQQKFPHLSVRIIGTPVVSVENATRIKRDSIMAISLSVILISILLLFNLRRKSAIAMILATIAFAWLFAMTCLSLFVGEVSTIVMGIGSVMIGIAVNYPLHLVMHLRFTPSARTCLEEEIRPLLVGNITTIAAFAAIIPLQASAMRELGIFATAMLIGTILFSIVFLPQMMRLWPLPPLQTKPIFHTQKWKTSPFLWIPIILITIILGFFSRQISFDDDLSHINYMTTQQRSDFALLTSMIPETESGHEDAAQWNTFWSEHTASVHDISLKLQQLGFADDFNLPFVQLTQNTAAEAPLDIKAIQKNIIHSLTGNFNYLGWICSAVVFIFLLLTLRNVKLTIIAFAPMLISWLWILGLMHLLGVQFNIVNMILASFIFGQGDDYTIFMVEGLTYEHNTGKSILPQYLQEITLSALIMFIAMGILVFAKHPAMHSLGSVTLIGMSCVVLLAWILPPLLFKLFFLHSNKN